MPQSLGADNNQAQYVHLWHKQHIERQDSEPWGGGPPSSRVVFVGSIVWIGLRLIHVPRLNRVVGDDRSLGVVHDSDHGRVSCGRLRYGESNE